MKRFVLGFSFFMIVFGWSVAIGTAAALSINRGVLPRDMDVSLLQQELKKAGAFLG